MANYAIGDVQGCFLELRGLLDLIHFDSSHDKLWLVGDLINRGPDSLRTIELIYEIFVDDWWSFPRPPLVANFIWNGQKIYIINKGLHK